MWFYDVVQSFSNASSGLWLFILHSLLSVHVIFIPKIVMLSLTLPSVSLNNMRSVDGNVAY